MMPLQVYILLVVPAFLAVCLMLYKEEKRSNGLYAEMIYWKQMYYTSFSSAKTQVAPEYHAPRR